MSIVYNEPSASQPVTQQTTSVQKVTAVRRGFEDSHLSDEFKITFWNRKHADSKGGVRTTIELAAEPRVAEHLFDMVSGPWFKTFLQSETTADILPSAL